MPLLDALGTPIPPLPVQPTALERTKSVATIASLAVVPVLVAFVGGYYSGATKDREVQAKFVELAVSILKEPPDKQSKSLREWATQVLVEYSGVKMSDEARRSLAVPSRVIMYPFAAGRSSGRVR